MSTSQSPGDDPGEIADNLSVVELREAIHSVTTDPEWESPVIIEITPSIAVQITRLVGFNGVSAAIEVLVREDMVDVSPLVTMTESIDRAISEDLDALGDIDPEKLQVAANLCTRGVELSNIAPVCTAIHGIIAGLPNQEINGETQAVGALPTRFNYVFKITSDGVVANAPGTPYGQGRTNPFDQPAHVFMTDLITTYTMDEMPESRLNEQWATRPEVQGHDAVESPNITETSISIGDVFFNTATDEYCWVIGCDQLLGALLQFEDGTFYDQQVRPDGVPAGPYERRGLPIDYDGPIPDPKNPCDVTDHSFDVTLPTSYHDIDRSICQDCGLSTSTLIELHGQFPSDHVTFECIGCETTGIGKDLISIDRLEETAICEACWDPTLTPRENYEKYSN